MNRNDSVHTFYIQKNTALAFFVGRTKVPKQPLVLPIGTNGVAFPPGGLSLTLALLQIISVHAHDPRLFFIAQHAH